MKTIFYFLIALTLFVGCISIKNTSHNKTEKYREFKKFKGDSTNYLTYNFINNKEKYIGKKMDVLFNDLEFEVKSYIYIPPFNNMYYVDCIMISFYNDQETTNRIGHKKKIDMLVIKLENPIPVDLVYKLNNDSSDWSKTHYAFFGDKIVKNVEI
jgi:hypothetical protein